MGGSGGADMGGALLPTPDFDEGAASASSLNLAAMGDDVGHADDLLADGGAPMSALNSPVLAPMDASADQIAPRRKEQVLPPGVASTVARTPSLPAHCRQLVSCTALSRAALRRAASDGR